MSEPMEVRPVGWTGPGGASVVAHWRATVALDNHAPARKLTSVMLEEWRWPESDDSWTGLEFVIMGGLDELPKGVGARFVLDDGESVRLMYAAGWNATHRYIGLKTLTSVGHRIGGDGPRTVYYLVMRKVSE